jgi:hypothetical protein
MLPKRKWVHVEPTLDYSILLDHPYYYEENWGKEYDMCWPFRQIK